jgi:carbonic anhydrase
MSNTNDKWSFADSFTWSNSFPRCSSKNQSPINIDTENIQNCQSLCDFKTLYQPSTCFVNYKNNLVRLKISPGSYIEYQNILYELKEITIHTPTLHSFDNFKYDLEICLIHNISSDNKTTTTTDTPNGIILCRLFESGPHYGNAESFINQVINEIPKEDMDYDKEIDVSESWGPNMLIPENKSFYMYDGSLPFPPCDTNYKVIIYEDIGNIGRTNLEIFKLNIGENVRNTQDIGDRIIMYKPYYKGDDDVDEMGDGTVSTNRFLKCVKDPIVQLLPEVTTPIPTIPYDGVGIDDTTRMYLKQIFLLIIVIFILVNAIIFVKYLFKHFYAQKLLILLIGREYLEGWIEKWETCNRSLHTEDLSKSGQQPDQPVQGQSGQGQGKNSGQQSGTPGQGQGRSGQQSGQGQRPRS